MFCLIYQHRSKNANRVPVAGRTARSARAVLLLEAEKWHKKILIKSVRRYMMIRFTRVLRKDKKLTKDLRGQVKYLKHIATNLQHSTRLANLR